MKNHLWIFWNFFVASLFATLASPLANASLKDWTYTCGSIPGLDSTTYCFYKNSPNPQSTIWFFHGISDSPDCFTPEQLSQSGNEAYRDFMDQLPPSNVVVVSFGWTWLITNFSPRDTDPTTATMKVFTKKVMPYLEKKFHPTQPYIATGHSMGGYNVAVACAAQPDLWSKCAILNGSIPSRSCDPFGQQSGSCNFWVNLYFQSQLTEQEWKASQPFSVLKSAVKLPNTLVEACPSDGWGFFTGPREWAATAATKNPNTIWFPESSTCDHDHWNNPRLMDFLRSK